MFSLVYEEALNQWTYRLFAEDTRAIHSVKNDSIWVSGVEFHHLPKDGSLRIRME